MAVSVARSQSRDGSGRPLGHKRRPVIHGDSGFDGVFTVLAQRAERYPAFAAGLYFVVEPEQTSLAELVADFVFTFLFLCHLRLLVVA